MKTFDRQSRETDDRISGRTRSVEHRGREWGGSCVSGRHQQGCVMHNSPSDVRLGVPLRTSATASTLGTRTLKRGCIPVPVT